MNLQCFMYHALLPVVVQHRHGNSSFLAFFVLKCWFVFQVFDMNSAVATVTTQYHVYRLSFLILATHYGSLFLSFIL